MSAVHCLKGLFEKTTAPPQTENNIQIWKSTLHNRCIFSLKILRMLILTAHSCFRSFVNIDWRKPLLPAFGLFKL